MVRGDHCGAFAVDLHGLSRLTPPMRSLFQLLLPGILVIAGCTTPPAEHFAAVPEASQSKASLPPPQPAPAPEPPAAKVVELPKPKAGNSKNASSTQLVVTPNPGLNGRVVTVNAAQRFVVLNFPVGHLPSIDQRLDLYRQGLKVGEVQVTGPQRDDHIVADIAAGEASPGDEVRER